MMEENNKVKLVKVLVFPATAAFMMGVSTAAIHAEENVDAEPNTDANVEEYTVDDKDKVLTAEQAKTNYYTDESDSNDGTDFVVGNGNEDADSDVDADYGVDTGDLDVDAGVATQPLEGNQDTPALQEVTNPVAWIGETGYATLEEAVNAAQSGDTIRLTSGKYTLYKKGAQTKGKDLTFVGEGTSTEWGIGATVPDPSKFGTEYNGDYSFDGAGTITFQNMTLQSGTVDYLGFIRADKTVVENCTINGKTFYWGYTSATFTNTIFNAPDYDYALWTYSSPTMTFDTCTFNTTGKVINVYRDYAGAHYTINFKDCTINNSQSSNWKETIQGTKQVLNINDSSPTGQSYTINISGDNKITGKTLNPDSITCSRLFGFGGKSGNNAGNTVVTIEGETVFSNGARVGSHEHDFSSGSYENGKVEGTENKYTEGYKDDAYTIISEGEWEKVSEDETGVTWQRTIIKRCNYCGEEIETIEKRFNNAPVINAEDKTIEQGSQFKPLDGVTATDVEDGPIETINFDGVVDTSKPGKYTITYEVEDSEGVKSTKTITVTVVAKEEPKPDTPDQSEDKKDDTSSKDKEEPKQTTTKKAVKQNSVKTGVATNIVPLVGLMGASLAGILVAKKRKDNE